MLIDMYYSTSYRNRLKFKDGYVLSAVVSYQKFVELAFDEAKSKGASFDGIDEGGDFMTDVAAVWSKNKEQYKQLTEQQTRNRLQDMVSA